MIVRSKKKEETVYALNSRTIDRFTSNTTKDGEKGRSVGLLGRANVASHIVNVLLSNEEKEMESE